MKLSIGQIQAPYFITLYGASGVGKSTLASMAENPLFLDVENGTTKINTKRITDLKTHEEFIDALKRCANDLSDKFTTLVIDTIDFLELLVHDKVARSMNKKSFTDISYGKGFDAAVEYWFCIFHELDKLRALGKNIILISHEQVKRYDNPTTESYDRYTLKLNHRIVNFILAKCDAVFFIARDFILKTSESGKQIAVSKPSRIVYAQETAAILAKNRFGLPEKFDLTRDFFTKLTTQSKPNESKPTEEINHAV